MNVYGYDLLTDSQSQCCPKLRTLATPKKTFYNKYQNAGFGDFNVLSLLSWKRRKKFSTNLFTF